MPVPAVSLRGITRRFGPVVANDDVSLDLEPGEIHALVGENGAGKTTLMRVLYGMLQPDAGRIEVEGRPARIQHPADAMRLGLGMVHQHFMLVDPLTSGSAHSGQRPPLSSPPCFGASLAARTNRSSPTATATGFTPRVCASAWRSTYPRQRSDSLARFALRTSLDREQHAVPQ